MWNCVVSSSDTMQVAVSLLEQAINMFYNLPSTVRTFYNFQILEYHSESKDIEQQNLLYILLLYQYVDGCWMGRVVPIIHMMSLNDW